MHISINELLIYGTITLVSLLLLTLFLCVVYSKAAKRNPERTTAFSNRFLGFIFKGLLVFIVLVIFCIVLFIKTTNMIFLCLLLSVVLIYIMPVMIFTLYVEDYFHKHLNGHEAKYKKGGYLYHWSDASYRYLDSKQWDSIVYENIKESGLIQLSVTQDKESIIVSVSANKAQHEKKILSLLDPHFNVHLYCMDFSGIPDDFQNNISNLTYIEGKRDALNLNQTLNEVGLSNVDIIIDKKGCLWHNKSQLDLFFQNCYMSLNNNGCLIIDGGHTYQFLRVLNYMSFKCFGEIFYPCEESTYSKIKEQLHDSAYVKEHFEEPIEVGEGLYKVVIIKKRSVI